MVLKNIKSMAKNRGFTIVELLVVIVVIGILASITVVSYTGVTTRARKSSNQTSASTIISAASAVHAETGAFPVTAADAATVRANLNAGVAKVPSTLPVTNATATAGADGAPDNLSYRVNTGGTGICVGYWDPTNSSVVYMFAGAATADSGTTCS